MEMVGTADYGKLEWTKLSGEELENYGGYEAINEVYISTLCGLCPYIVVALSSNESWKQSISPFFIAK